MSLEALSSRAIIGRYYQRLSQNSGLGWVSSVSNFFNSDQAFETYEWLGQTPVMREFIGDRQAKGLSSQGMSIKNQHFEATLEVSVADMRRDKTGQVLVRIDELADRTNSHWAQLLSSLILGGESLICYDEHYYFDELHREQDSGVQSNRLTLNLADFEKQIDGGKVGTPTNPSEAALRLAILQTIQQILTFKDNQGEPLNENANQFLVMVPTTMWYVAKSALAVPLSVGGSTNPVKVLNEIDITLVQNPRLKTWSDKFVVFRTDSAIRPMIRPLRAMERRSRGRVVRGRRRFFEERSEFKKSLCRRRVT